MASFNGLEAHARPPESMRMLFKKHLKSTLEDIDHDRHVISSPFKDNEILTRLSLRSSLNAKDLQQSFEDFIRSSANATDLASTPLVSEDASMYEVTALPGLFIIPALLPPHIQVEMLNRLLHRDLSNPSHNTNLHLHYNILYCEEEEPNSSLNSKAHSASFFSTSPSAKFAAKDPAVHKDISMRQVLDKKLRWVTLGGQYDWTAKEYPAEEPPAFPADIGNLLRQLFPGIDPQAAILNLYTPGDTLRVHRDVSEMCDRDLVSISIGCDAMFICGNEDGSDTATLRLKSGDAVCMTGPSRFSWHAVPKVVPNTCPEWLQHWPAMDSGTSTFRDWRGWMSNKRINLNIRQMIAC